MAAQNNDWESLRRDARRLEAEIDKKLIAFSKLSATFAHANQPGEAQDRLEEGIPLIAETTKVADTMERELETLFQQFSSTVEQLNRVSEETGRAAVHVHVVQRHRDIFHDYTLEFKKTRAAISAAMQQAELLGHVRRDTAAFKSGSRSDALLRERGSLHSSISGADALLTQAALTSEALSAQRRMIEGMSGRLGQLRTRFPAVNSLITSIQRRSRRDQIILALVVACCVFFLLYTLILRS